MRFITKAKYSCHRWALCSISIVSLSAILFLSPSLSFAIDIPKQLRVTDTVLYLNGQATRKRLLFVKVYDIGLYLPTHITNKEDITSDIKQAFAIVIRYTSNKKVGIPQAWREELLPALSQQQIKNLKTALSNANKGDMFKIEFSPKSGTKIMLEDEVILSESSYEIMSAFIDVWLGSEPVSRRLAKLLLSQP